MIESAEGIGSRKWSFLREEDGLYLMQGKTKLARLTDDGEKVLHLLATAPQLWDAGNELLKLHHSPMGVASDRVIGSLVTLGNMVAKAVGKQDWDKVLQA